MSDMNGSMPQLEMLWTTHELIAGEAPKLRSALEAQTPELLPLHLAPGYGLRFFRAGADDEEYLALMAAAGFDDWPEDRLILCHMTSLPDGWYLAIHEESGVIAATAMATHRPVPYHAYGGELGWVAAHPDHRGRKLGWTVCAAVTNRLLQAGYRNIYLKTDDFRAPAILTYLRMGYVPYLYTGGMRARWQTICTLLNWPFTPDNWPIAPN